ncbi:uncharacterized protein LOC142463565 isoform X2 [Ascaphus truei]|uniref:uncharacterized protein LOC142463565 isoform X2 n=1 Tax=Ascaphus truei TaxID=8439 RepID=UPI003F59B949
MACQEVLLLLLLHRTCAVLELSAPSTQRARIGSDVLLTCTFSVDKLPVDPNFLATFWYFQDREILRYDNKGTSHRRGLSLNEQAARDGDVSLSVSNVNIADGGIYRCLVIYSPERKEKAVTLHVLAPPMITITDNVITKNTESTLRCKATAFYPVEIDITWLRDGQVIKGSIMGKPQENSDGTYRVDSTVIITPTEDHMNLTFSCRVLHASMQDPLQENFTLAYGVPTGNKVAVVTLASCTTAVLLLAGAVIGAILWIRKHRKKDLQKFMVNDIKGPEKLMEGEEVTLYCTASHCTGEVRVRWLEKRAGTKSEIPQPQSGHTEEAEELLGRSYVVTLNKEGSQDHTTSLRFIPCVEKHNDMTFICRFVGGGKTREKRFQCKTIYAKPQMLEPVKPTLCVSGELLYSLILGKFYPKDIQISWTRGVGNAQENISSKEQFEENPDLTFTVCSEIRIPEKLFTDPSFKVCFTWKHGSMDHPGNKEVSIRDSEFPWTPIVEEIQKPPLLHETPVTLQCNISAYFPDALTVTWLRRDGTQGVLEELNADRVTIPDITSHKDADNSYSCTARLTVTPTLATDQGGEYICRVEHPSLEQPIERSTGKLSIVAKPENMKPIQVKLTYSARVQFFLNLQRFYPKDIQISWGYGQKQLQSNVKSTETLKEHSDLTSDVTSMCSILGDPFRDPAFKVYVTWEHVSMDVPESRELSVRDFPWHPQVEEIITPRLKAKKQATLTCKISNYFPDSLIVQWYKQEQGDQLVTALPTANYKVPAKRSRKQADHTWAREACVTFTPSLSTDQGAAFICRVKHPSLEQPAERRTGPLIIQPIVVPGAPPLLQARLSIEPRGNSATPLRDAR